MNYVDVKSFDMNNGEGIRVSVWCSGCPIKCEGCHNYKIWDNKNGKPFTEGVINYIIKELNKDIMKGLTLIGGEPFAEYNINDYITLCKRVKEVYPNINIWVYSGYTYNEIIKDKNKLELLKLCDVLVDGKFIEALKDENLRFRGSSNQRVIDIQESMLNNCVINYKDYYKDIRLNCTLNKQVEENMNMKTRGFETVENNFRKTEGNVTLPVRGSQYAAGYDFVATRKLTIEPNKKEFFWTDVRAYMQQDEVLELYVRSSMGVKKGLMLSNTVGIIDCDYYDNESTGGNIGISLYNTSNEIVIIEKGERVCQGIFKKFLVADNCNTEMTRIGGFGSTDK